MYINNGGESSLNNGCGSPYFLRSIKAYYKLCKLHYVVKYNIYI